MGKWIFRMFAMMAVGGAVIFTAQFREDGRPEKSAAVETEQNHLAEKRNGAEEVDQVAKAEEKTGEKEIEAFGNGEDGAEAVRKELVDLYFRALRDLIRSDFGLAEDVACFGFDFSQAGSLTEREGRDLADRLKKKFYKRKVIFGTFEELEKVGYIRNDGGGMHWSDGLLLTLKVTEEKERRIVFSMSAWRSGLGAVGKDDCTACRAKMGAKGKDGCEAEEEGGKWQFDFDKSGNFWIS